MKEDIEEKVNLLSNSYLTELKYNPKGEEVINVLTSVYKEMLKESQNNSCYLMNKHQIEMFNLLDGEVYGMEPLSSLVQFSLMPDVQGQYLKQGLQLQTNSSIDTLLTVTLQEAIYVSNTTLNSIYCMQGKTGKIIMYEGSENFYPFDFSKEGQEKNMFSFDIPYLFDEYPSTHFELFFAYLDTIATSTMIHLVGPTMQWYLQSQGTIICPLKVRLHQKYLEISYEKKYLENLSLIDTPITVAVYCKDTRKVKDCYFDQIYARSSSSQEMADFVYVEQVPVEGECFYPFTKEMEIFTTSYLAFSNVLCRKGATITLVFTTDYQLIEVNPFLVDEKEYHMIMRSLPKEVIEPTDIFCDIVVFEYFNGEQWTIIPELKKEKNIFQDAISKNICLHFVCPDTITKTEIEGIETYWIRIRMLNCENRYQYPLKMHVPMIKNVKASYQYKNTDLMVKEVEVLSQLESHFYPLLEHQKIEPFTVWHQTNDAMYLCFNEDILGSPFTLYIECTGQGKVKQTLRFYIDSDKECKEITVEDGTEGLLHSGIWRFYIDGKVVKKKYFNEEGYWIKIVNMTKDTNRSICIESIQKNIALVKEGNEQTIQDVVTTYSEDLEILLPDTQINQLIVSMYEKTATDQGQWMTWSNSIEASRHYGYDPSQQRIRFAKEELQKYGVSSYKVEFIQTQKTMQQVSKDSAVFFLEDNLNIMDSKTICHSYGSLPSETNEQAISRMAASMQYYQGIITSEGLYQYLLHEYRAILDVKVLEQKDALGTMCKKQLTIACMTKDYLVDINSFYTIKKEIEKYIMQYTNVGFTDSLIVIMEPIYIEVKLTIRVIVSSGHALAIKTKLVDYFTDYFNPIKGRDGSSWKIGEYPQENDIIECIRKQNIPCYVKDCYLQGSFTYQGITYVQSVQEFSTIPLGCILSGKHHIEVIKGDDIYVG